MSCQLKSSYKMQPTCDKMKGDFWEPYKLYLSVFWIKYNNLNVSNEVQ